MQYDVWLPGPDRARINALDSNNLTPAVRDCNDIAKAAIAGTLGDHTRGATFYYEPTIPGPAWLAGARWCGQFGNQLFWKVVK
jgi:spore germination cell wall hydrolase CwlJ-like protein